MDKLYLEKIYNFILKYVITDIADLIIEYTSFAGTLIHNEKIIYNDNVVKCISSDKKNRIVIGYLKNKIEMYDFDIGNNNKNSIKYKLKNIDILHNFLYTSNILKQYIINHVPQEYIVNQWFTNKILLLNDNIILSLIGWFNNKLNHFIIVLNYNDFELENDNTYELLKNKNYANISLIFNNFKPDKKIPDINDYYITGTPDENFIVCVHNDNTIHFYDSHNLNKIYILRNEINIKKLSIVNVDLIINIYYSNKYMLIIYTDYICVCELLAITKKYIFKRFIKLTKKYINDILFLSDHEIIIMFKDNTINVYNILDGNVKNFLKLINISKRFTPNMHIINGKNPKILIILQNSIRIYKHDFSLYKEIFIKNINKNLLLFIQDKIFLLNNNEAKIINTKTGNIYKSSEIKNKINNYNKFKLLSNDVIALLYNDTTNLDYITLWE
jgi:hypothetical protein